MLQSKKEYEENKNIYFVGGIILLFVIFMLVSVVMVVSQVSQGSSADMLRKRNASAHYEMQREYKESYNSLNTVKLS